MQIKAFYDAPTSTLTYLVWDPQSKDAVAIDPVLNYDPLGSQTSTTSIDALIGFIREHGLRLHWSLETHAHADHFSGGQILKHQLEAETAISEHIIAVQETFKPIFAMPDEFPTDGSQFDRLLKDGEVLQAGTLAIEVIHTPGHTPACVTFKIDDALFTGDALFMDDYGTGRCDFPKGSSGDLYDSVARKLYTMPDETRVFVGHDYQPGGRELRWQTTIGASKRNNPQLRASTSKEDFVRFRDERDGGLAAPRLLFPSVQVNIDGGRIPAEDANGIRHLSLPLNLFGPTDNLGRPKRS